MTLTNGTFSGNGSGLTNLNANNVSTGTLADARLSSNVALKNINNNFSADQTVNGNVQANGNLGVTGAGTLGSLGVTGATTLHSTLDVTSNTTVGGTLGVTGTTTLNGLTNSTGNITNNGNYTSPAGDLTLTSGNATVGGNLGVTGAATLGSTLDVTGNYTSTNGNLSLTNGNAAVGGALGVTGATTLGSTLDVTGNYTSTNGSMTLTNGTFTGNGSGLTNLNASNVSSGTLNDSRLSSNVALKNINNSFSADQTVNGNVQANGNLGVTGAGTLGSLGVTGATTLHSTLDVTGNTTMGGNLGVTGTTTLNGFTNSTGNITNNGNYTSSTGDLTLTSGNASVGGNLGVTGTTTLSAVNGAQLLAGNAADPNTLGPPAGVISGTNTGFSGVITLYNGTYDYYVNNTNVKAGSAIIATYDDPNGGDILTPYVSKKEAGTGFRITVSGDAPSGATHATVNYIIINP